ncbi:MAG TPA: hypothetical protein VMS30_11400 [Phycisphaerales bacterium]|nr:hypothetical protein [Phycisphaerales bacterium]
MPIRSGEHEDFEDDDAFDADEPIDEGPSSEDIERLDHETAICPDCGAQIWDAAEICPKCYAYIGGDVVQRRPIPKWLRLALLLLLAAGLIIITLACFMSPAYNNNRLPG